jgi:hypothetical protein
MGYQPSATAASGVLLSQLRTQLGTGFEHATLELHEFGALVNRHWRASNEPGAFGAAWTVANWQAALASGISRAFHWGFEDSGLPGTDLLDSSAWAMAMAEGAVRASPVGLAFALDVKLSTGAALPAKTTVTAFAVREGAAEQDGLYIFVASLNSAKVAVPTLSLQLELPQSLLPAPLAGMQLHEFRMDASASPFDVALAELTRQNSSASESLLKWDDGEVYSMSQMATPAGLTALKPNISEFEAMQAESLLPQLFRGTATTTGGGLRLSFAIATPCALVVRLRKA